MNCSEVRPILTALMDGVAAGREAGAVHEHLAGCSHCRAHFHELKQTQRMIAGLGRKPAPPDLAMKLRVALSREASQSFARRLDAFVFRFENAVNSMLVPATAGVLTSVIFFGLVIGFITLPAQLAASNDVPTPTLYSPPQLSATQFDFTSDVANEGVVVEAFINPQGHVSEYRVLYSPDGKTELSPKLKNALLFTMFQPATAFGQPTSGRVVLTFSHINVGG